jgi:hypothetical protein
MESPGVDALGQAVAVAVACTVGTYLYSLRHSNALLAAARETALTQAELIRAGLEHHQSARSLPQDRGVRAELRDREPRTRELPARPDRAPTRRGAGHGVEKRDEIDQGRPDASRQRITSQ